MSGADLAVLAAHLEEETDALVAALGAGGAAAWDLATPSEGWSVKDQVSHLAYFDEAATASVADPPAFEAMRAEAFELGIALCDVIAARYRDRTPGELLAWLRAARRAMVDAMLAKGPSTRVPWYGPDFSIASALTGRIMETWAHGQDVYDALGVEHPATDALYDVARLCARTRANSYAARGLGVPADDVAVELAAPDGSTWAFGGGAERITGSAVDFCLVATQRRHLDDTSLVASGPLAAEWLSIAQAFAGPAGEGRAPRGAGG
jgi:uncharacterized protein (TIGR03084 family)